MATLVVELRLPVSAEEAFAFHADVRNLPRLMPPPGARIVRAPTPTRAGDVQVIELGPRFAPIRWVAHVTAFEPPRLIVDEQRRGPFMRFRHAHVVVPDGAGSMLTDIVDFRSFGGPIGRILDQLVVTPLLRIAFRERHRRTLMLFSKTTYQPWSQIAGPRLTRTDV